MITYFDPPEPSKVFREVLKGWLVQYNGNRGETQSFLLGTEGANLAR
jgi:hypothetical protein